MKQNWNYEVAFSRNLGLISADEQRRLKQTRIAIPGMGGVGGVHLITLLRTGFEKFTIADFDTFGLHNFNRQYGAEMDSIGESKADWMAKKALAINPQADIRIMRQPIDVENVDAFLQDAALVVDGIDAFAVRARRTVYKRAAQKGMHVISAGPLGFSTSWLVLSPTGMSCDDYFGFRDSMSDTELMASFITGISPRSSHLQYMDTSFVNFETGVGPSAGLSCQLCAGVVAAEAIKIVLQRPGIRAAPHYQQFDAYLCQLHKGRMWWGAKNPLFLFKRKIVQKILESKIKQLAK